MRGLLLKEEGGEGRDRERVKGGNVRRCSLRLNRAAGCIMPALMTSGQQIDSGLL